MKNCIVCGNPIPAVRGVRAKTCSKECSRARPKPGPQEAPERRLYDYPETEYSRCLKRLGWSQSEASRILGHDARTSRKYNSGDLRLSYGLQTLLRLAVHLGLSESAFDPKLDYVENLIRIVYKYEVGERQFFKIAATPIN